MNPHCIEDYDDYSPLEPIEYAQVIGIGLVALSINLAILYFALQGNIFAIAYWIFEIVLITGMAFFITATERRDNERLTH